MFEVHHGNLQTKGTRYSINILIHLQVELSIEEMEHGNTIGHMFEVHHGNLQTKGMRYFTNILIHLHVELSIEEMEHGKCRYCLPNSYWCT